MPYLGFLDRNEQEIRAAPGYVRRDLADVHFKISPPVKPGDHLVFVNATAIEWPPARGKWPDLYGLALYDEVDSPEPSVVRAFPTAKWPIGARDRVVITPGALTLPMHIDKGRDWHWDTAPINPVSAWGQR